MTTNRADGAGGHAEVSSQRAAPRVEHELMGNPAVVERRESVTSHAVVAEAAGKQNQHGASTSCVGPLMLRLFGGVGRTPKVVDNTKKQRGLKGENAGGRL